MYKINLDEIISQENRRAFDEEGYSNYFTVMQRNIIKKAMLYFGKQLLELAAENAKTEVVQMNIAGSIRVVNRQSILETINQVR